MRTIKYLIITIIGILAFTSCDFLDKEEDTELTLPMVFEDKNRVEGWLANVYSGIPDPIQGYAQRIGWDILGDEMTPSERWRQYDGWKVIPYILGQWSTNSGWDGDYWAGLPQRIRSAYIFMENVKPLPEQGLTAKEVEYMKAECRFIIAYYYYLLVNTYGPIPFQPNYVAPADFTLADLMVGQTPYDDIINWIDKELVAVSKLLPPAYTESNKYGRATSIMCQAVRARMLLFAASDLTNGNPDYDGIKNSDGVLLFNSSKQSEKWQKATAACRELIVEAEAAGHTLYIERNTDGSIDPFSSYQNLFLNDVSKGNKEILFARPVCDYGGFENLAMPRGSNAAGGYGVTQKLVDAFFTQSGLPITAAGTEYKESGFSSQNDVRQTKWEGARNGVITREGTYNMYCNREPRFYVSVYYSGAFYPNDNSDARYLDFRLGKIDNDGSHDSPQNGYLVRKKTSPVSNNKTGYRIYRPGILYRLGEAYLNYAEALNESEPGNADILVYLNKIRERAGIRLYTTGATNERYIHVNISDQDAIRKLIRAERNVELCCEGLRYDDLRRWKSAMQELNGAFYGMNFNGTDYSDETSSETAFFVRTPYQTRVYKKEYYWFPVHQNEIDKNSKLVQAPFWK